MVDEHVKKQMRCEDIVYNMQCLRSRVIDDVHHQQRPNDNVLPCDRDIDLGIDSPWWTF